jgi:DNA repair exonuclease SbcCD ATPase subunit
MQSLTAEEDVLVGLLTRAQQVLEHTAEDLSNVDQKKAAIDEQIKSKTIDVHKEKQELAAKHQVLEMERDDLLEKLREKEKELKQCQDEIDARQKEIDLAAKAFERELRKLRETREQILVDKESRQKEHNELTLKKMSLEKKKQLVSEQEAKFEKLLAFIDKKMNVRLILHPILFDHSIRMHKPVQLGWRSTIPLEGYFWKRRESNRRRCQNYSKSNHFVELLWISSQAQLRK